MKQIVKYAALILNENDEILVARKHGKNIWINIGGRVEQGESPIECIKREIREELSCNIEEEPVPQKFLETPFTPALDDPDSEVKIIWYRIDLLGEPKASSEIEEIRWIDPKKPSIELSPQIKEYLLPAILKN